MTDPRRGPSLLQKLVLATVLAGVLGGVVGAVIIRATTRSALIEEARLRNLRTADRLADRVHREVRGVRSVLEAIAVNERVVRPATEMDIELRVALRAAPDLDALIRLDADGSVLAEARSGELADPSTAESRPDILAALSRHGSYLSVAERDWPQLDVAVPVEDPPGTLSGALVGTAPFVVIGASVEDLRIDQTGRASLLHDDGHVIVHHERHRVVSMETSPLHGNIATGGRSRILDTQRGAVLASIAPVPEFPGSVVVEQSIEDVLSSAAARTRDLMIILGVVLLAAVLVVILAGRRLLRPLHDLVGAVRRLGAGERSARVGGPVSGDELGLLVTEFNRMADELDERWTELELAKAERETALRRVEAQLAVVEEAERSLRSSEQRLRAVDEMKNNFLSAVSHELRTPLSAVLGFAMTLEHAGSELPEERRREFVRRITGNAEKLQRLLGDLLDMDRIRRGITTARRRPTNIEALIGRIVEDAGDLTSAHLVRVDAAPVTVAIDPTMAERIVENLLANAVRHTPVATEVVIRAVPDGDGVEIHVDDEGPGVPQALRTTIFEPFQQGPNVKRHSPGVGIGLALVARFAAMHGGQAWVVDRPQGGASFRVTLPGPSGDEDLEIATVEGSAEPSRSD